MGVAAAFRTPHPREFSDMPSPGYSPGGRNRFPSPPVRTDTTACREGSAPCPHCQGRTGNPPEDQLLGGLWRGAAMVVSAVLLIVLSLLRAARFAVAAAFCVVAVIGAAARAIALRIVHPADRRLLPR